jgi:hypothetical protein
MATAASLTSALMMRTALHLSREVRGFAWFGTSLLVAASPCLLPTTAQPQRLLATLVAIILVAKLYDIWRQPQTVRAWRLRKYALYLVNGFWLTSPYPPPRTSPMTDRRKLLRSGTLSLLLLNACGWAFSYDWWEVPFFGEHCFKVTVVILTVVHLVNAIAAAWRLAGGAALDPMRNPVAARTPADFWRRWNVPVYQFLQVYVFRPSGGARHPRRGLLCAFAVSGVLHEYVFAMASGRLQGYQLMFFALQGLAAAVTLRWRPSGWRAGLLTAGTATFNLLTALLFFRSVDTVLSFYSPR